MSGPLIVKASMVKSPYRINDTNHAIFYAGIEGSAVEKSWLA